MPFNTVHFTDPIDLSSVILPSYTSTVKHLVKAGASLNKGQAVYITGSTGNDGTNMIVNKASNSQESTSSKTLGLLESTLDNNQTGYVVTEGLLGGLDTSSASQAGDPVWLGIDGNLIYGLTNKPKAPDHLVFIGIVTRKQQNNGEIFVKVQNGFELEELHNLVLTDVQGGDVITWDSISNKWINSNISASGIQGIQGTQGITGDQGTIGIQGILGTQGTQGAIGNNGIQGLQGIQGEIGLQGNSGNDGTNGLQGIQGLQGFAGSAGLQGSQGLQGLQGFTGNAGLQGLQGSQGLQGLQGSQGLTGNGLQGTQGIQGFTGNTGIQGLQGLQGFTGQTGSQGTSASDLNSWTAYTPTWTSDSGTPSIGNGSIVGRYKQIGKTVFFNLKLTYGSTTTGGSGTWMFGLPVTAYNPNYQFAASILNDGLAWYGAIGNGNYKGSTSYFSLIHQNDTITTVWGGVGSANPFTFGAADTLTVSGSYEAA